MPKIEDSFRHITRAALLMARSNGGVGRFRREEDFLNDLTPVLMHSPHDLSAIDAWLGTRNSDQLLTIVDGERTEMESELVGAPSGTDMLLHDIFEGVV